jgi:hypothetical protein
MGTEISMYVRFRGKERLLRLAHEDGRWYAHFTVPGEVDMQTGKIVDPAPPGTQLPIVKLRDFQLRIEGPKNHVVSLEMGKLLSTRGMAVQHGWIAIALTSVMADSHVRIGLRHLKDRARRPCIVLDFGEGARNCREKQDRGVER